VAVRLLQGIWTDTAAEAAACASVRRAMGQQLTRHRIASGFGPDVKVAAKSGGLMGLVRNEAGVMSVHRRTPLRRGRVHPVRTGRNHRPGGYRRRHRPNRTNLD
jgi:hypothetical protein